MSLFETDSRHSIFLGNTHATAVVFFNDDRYAVAGVEHDSTPGGNLYALNADEVALYIPQFYELSEVAEYNLFVAIDVTTGKLIERREWLRLNGALFVEGKEFCFGGEYDAYLGTAVTVCRKGGTAILSVYGGEGYVFAAYRMFGYDIDTIEAAFPGFRDEYTPVGCNNFYLCVRMCDDTPVNLSGDSVADEIEELLNDESFLA